MAGLHGKNWLVDFTPMGPCSPGAIEQYASLLNLPDPAAYSTLILIASAEAAEANDRICEAVKLYNLAGDYNLVILCLAQALGNTIAQNSPDERPKEIERTNRSLADPTVGIKRGKLLGGS